MIPDWFVASKIHNIAISPMSILREQVQQLSLNLYSEACEYFVVIIEVKCIKFIH